MNESTSREKILKNIRRALTRKVSPKEHVKDFETSAYNYSDEEPEIEFARKFTSLQGKFDFCENHTDFVDRLLTLMEDRKWFNIVCTVPEIQDVLNKIELPYNQDVDLTNADVCITGCEALVSFTGGIMVSSRQFMGRTSTIVPPVHVVIGYSSQIVRDIKQGYSLIRRKYEDGLPSMICMIAGPSRTADIEKTLVLGAHGPKELLLFLVDDLA